MDLAIRLTYIPLQACDLRLEQGKVAGLKEVSAFVVARFLSSSVDWFDETHTLLMQVPFPPTELKLNPLGEYNLDYIQSSLLIKAFNHE